MFSNYITVTDLITLLCYSMNFSMITLQQTELKPVSKCIKDNCFGMSHSSFCWKNQRAGEMNINKSTKWKRKL